MGCTAYFDDGFEAAEYAHEHEHEEKTCTECGGYLNDKMDDICFKCWHLSNLGEIKREALEAIKHGKAVNWLKAMNKDITDSTYNRLEKVINKKAAQVWQQEAA